MQLYNGLPVFEVNYDENSIMNCVSIVDEPANESYFIRMSKQADVKMAINEEKREVLGVVLEPEQMIYRRDDKTGKEYYIKFGAETIKKFALDFFENHRNTEGDVQHRFEVDGVVFYQSFLMDKEKGIAPKAFEELPNGTWILGAHIYNDDVWALIKDGTLRGFSVDLVSTISEAKNEELKTLDELIKYLNNN